MADEETFLQGVLADPDDESARLVLADWLEEHGQGERAEFIRVQCQLAALTAGDPRLPALAARERDLLARHREEWAGPLVRFVSGYRFRRGFVEAVSLQAEAFLYRAEALFRWAPVRSVRFHQSAGLVRRLAASPYLARLTSLDLSWNRLGDRELEVLAAAPHLGRLAALDLHDNFDLSVSGAKALARSSWLKGVSVLRLGNTVLHNPGVEALVAGFDRGQLKELDMGGAGFGSPGAAALAASPACARLSLLRLSFNSLGDEAARALARSPYLGELRSLRLRRTEIGDAGARALADSPHLGKLAGLYLAENGISPDAAAALRARFGDRVY